MNAMSYGCGCSIASEVRDDRVVTINAFACSNHRSDPDIARATEVLAFYIRGIQSPGSTPKILDVDIYQPRSTVSVVDRDDGVRVLRIDCLNSEMVYSETHRYRIDIDAQQLMSEIKKAEEGVDET